MATKVYTGAWRTAAVAGVDPTPAASIPANVAHLSAGGIPEGKPPIQGPALDIPIVVEDPDNAFEWGDDNGTTWDRYGVTDMTDHNAYALSSGEVPLEVTGAEDAAWRGQDKGAPTGRAFFAPTFTQHNEIVTLNTPHFADAGSPVQRGARAGAVNNPDGIPGHTTPKTTVRNQRKFPTPYRTHDQYSASKIRVITATSTRAPGNGDRYSSPFLSSANAAAYPAGPRQPAMYTFPQQWDQALATGNTALLDGSTPNTNIVEPGVEAGWSNGF